MAPTTKDVGLQEPLRPTVRTQSRAEESRRGTDNLHHRYKIPFNIIGLDATRLMR